MSKEIAKKMASIMTKVKYIQKRGRNQFHKYNYATEADVNDAVREHMAEMNMIMIPSVKATSIRETTTRNGNIEYIARVDMDFTFIDGDSGESVTLSMSGEGQDTGDKAIYKAISGTQKYAIMKTFMIPTGDDPERDDEQPQQQRTNQSPPANQRQTNNLAGKVADAAAQTVPETIRNMWLTCNSGKLDGLDAFFAKQVAGKVSVASIETLLDKKVTMIIPESVRDLWAAIHAGDLSQLPAEYAKERAAGKNDQQLEEFLAQQMEAKIEAANA